MAFGPGDSGRLVACCTLLSDCPFPLDDSNPERGASGEGHSVWTTLELLPLSGHQQKSFPFGVVWWHLTTLVTCPNSSK